MLICLFCVIGQLEKSLKAQIDLWEAAHFKEFRVNAQPFLQYVEDQWDQHRMEKEREKQERVRTHSWNDYFWHEY